MERLKIAGRFDVAGGCLVAGLLVLFTIAVSSSSPASVKASKQKRYYLTTSAHLGGAALTACESGFHMASLWEIRDTTDLTYDAERGTTRADSGSGPAAELFGWIRTGGGGSGSPAPGVGNCEAWTSSEVSDLGTMVELNGQWTAAAVNASPWNAVTNLCSDAAPVWCVEE